MSEKNINARVIHKHDTETNWNKATNFIPKQGEIIVYDIDGSYSYERFKIGDGVTVVSSLPFTTIKPKFTTVTLPTANWTGSTSPWSQVVTISGVTENSKVDLQPSATQLTELQNSNIALMTENDNGVVTVYAINNKPTSDYTIQVTITEIEGVSA